MKAGDVMTSPVLTVGKDTSVRHACQIMMDHRISGLPVVDDERRVVGVITEGDLLRRLQSKTPPQSAESGARDYLKRDSWKVGDVMSDRVVATDEGATLSEIAALLAEHGIKRVLVMRDGSLAGIVSRADLLHAIASQTRNEIRADGEAIRLAVSTRIREDVGVGGVDVTVQDGMVHLWGNVGSDYQRDAAEAAAENVGGALTVANHLRVSMRGRQAASGGAT
jgi:CBS domain-containing protein